MALDLISFYDFHMESVQGFILPGKNELCHILMLYLCAIARRSGNFKM